MGHRVPEIWQNSDKLAVKILVNNNITLNHIFIEGVCNSLYNQKKERKKEK